ncbi:diacylglycerol kinase family protein [Larkinella terrae]|uniref:Diacylglycerol kinase family protein n=1 Tax=Larkinella terrae TaxID=2025311 RepID=A0A7K0EQN6_9BACT|nr:diacylglycerol kinase family protein [Larkinella terrae]MRS64107.1 diacylglycerol kinase family protein [Larkinella terrae]
MSRWIDVRKNLRSFRFAVEGIGTLFRFENNAKIHLLAAIAVVIAGIWLRLNRTEWALILTQVGLVLAAEAFNTAIEKLADVVSPERHPQIKAVKDLSAAGVLLVVIIAVIVGILIFGTKLIEMDWMVKNG